MQAESRQVDKHEQRTNLEQRGRHLDPVKLPRDPLELPLVGAAPLDGPALLLHIVAHRLLVDRLDLAHPGLWQPALNDLKCGCN